jgi:hypothetical protein
MHTADVRETARDALHVIMRTMSGYGIKLIFPSLLSERTRNSDGLKGLDRVVGHDDLLFSRNSRSRPPRLTGVGTYDGQGGVSVYWCQSHAFDMCVQITTVSN